MGDTSSWFTGLCVECGYPVVVTQPNMKTHPTDDYRWYCSNPDCIRHIHKEHTGDMENPEWVKNVE